MGKLSDTRWPVFGIRVTEANLRPDFGSVSPSWTDRGLKTGGYEGYDQVTSRRLVQIVRVSPKDDMHRDLAANHVQVLDGCRRTVLVPVHQLKQNSKINTETESTGR
jgi:hypothetical protein